MSPTIKSSLVELEKRNLRGAESECLPSTSRSYSSRRLVINVRHPRLRPSSQSRWWGLVSQLSPSPLPQDRRGADKQCCQHVKSFTPGVFKEAEPPEEVAARRGTLAALCMQVRKAVFTYWNSWSLIIYFSWHVESLLSNEAPLCATCSKHERRKYYFHEEVVSWKGSAETHTQTEKGVAKVHTLKIKKKKLFIICYYYFVRYSKNLLKLIFILTKVNLKNAKEGAIILDVYYVVV